MDPNNPNSSSPSAPPNQTPSNSSPTPSPDATAPSASPTLEQQTPLPVNPYASSIPDSTPPTSATTPNPWDAPTTAPSGAPSFNPPLIPSATPTDSFTAPIPASSSDTTAQPFNTALTPDPATPPTQTPDTSFPQKPLTTPMEPSTTPSVTQPASNPPLDNSVYSSSPSQPSSEAFNNYTTEPTQPATPTPSPVFDQTAADPNAGILSPSEPATPTNTLSSLGIGSDLPSSESSQAVPTGIPETPPTSLNPEPSAPDPLHSEPAEPAPTDLSQLSGLGTPPEIPTATSPTPAPPPTETVTIPPAETSTQNEKTHKFPKLLLFGGIALVLLVILLSVYLFFIRGNSTPAPSSLPAQTTSDQLPLTNPPAPITQPAQAPAATSSADTQGTNGFGSFTPNGATNSATQTHQSAFEVAKAREAAATQSAAPATP